MIKETIFLQLFEKSSLIIVLFIIITKIKGFKYILQKEIYELKDLLIISLNYNMRHLSTIIYGNRNKNIIFVG